MFPGRLAEIVIALSVDKLLGMDKWFNRVGLVICVVVGLAVPLCSMIPSFANVALIPIRTVAFAFAGVLFLRILMDRRCHRRIDDINIELRGGQPFGYGYRNRKSLLDSEWGLFGSRTGSRPMQLLRLVLLVVYGVTLLFSGPKGSPEILLAFSGFAVAVLVSMLELATSKAE